MKKKEGEGGRKEREEGGRRKEREEGGRRWVKGEGHIEPSSVAQWRITCIASAGQSYPHLHL